LWRAVVWYPDARVVWWLLVGVWRAAFGSARRVVAGGVCRLVLGCFLACAFWAAPGAPPQKISDSQGFLDLNGCSRFRFCRGLLWSQQHKRS
jgi:hypothetical protein